MEQTFGKAARLIRELTNFGVSLIVVGVVIDILFPGTTGIVENLGTVVANISDKGIAGLIALLLFVALYRRGEGASAPA